MADFDDDWFSMSDDSSSSDNFFGTDNSDNEVIDLNSGSSSTSNSGFGTSEGSSSSFGDDMFGFRTEEMGSNDTSSTPSSSSSDVTKERKPGFITRMRESMGNKKFGILLAILSGTIILVIVVLLFGGDTPTKPGDTPKVTSAPVQQTQSTPKQSSGDWSELTDVNLSDSEEINGVFTITEMHTYGRKTSGKIAPLELRAEAVGAVDGDGSYKVEIPMSIVNLVKIGTRLKVNFKVGVSGDVKILYDIQIAR